MKDMITSERSGTEHDSADNEPGSSSAKFSSSLFFLLVFFSLFFSFQPSVLGARPERLQNDRGMPRTCSPMYDKIRFVEIGAT
jgi:hypothetical protein